GPARLTLPEQRLQNAPVLMAAPQIAPVLPQSVVSTVNKLAAKPPDRVIIPVAHGKQGKSVRTAATQPRGRAQAVVIRGSHLKAASHSGASGGRRVMLIRVSQIRGSAGRGARH